ncbi:MAG: ABC transporter permease subunit [Eubacterium sp.]|nr:ABC transporter permease subunit [Eubacterium sp.]
MTMPFNSPIIKKDLKVISRSMKFSWGLFAYIVALSIVFFLTYSTFSLTFGRASVNNTDIYEGFVYFFPIVGSVQLSIIGLIVPVITASSISGERERKTMDVLLTTTITEPQIIMGKIGSAIVRVMTFVFASIPLMSVSFIMGGLSWIALFEYILLAFIFAFMTGAIGTFCSSVCRKSITAIILSYVIYFGVYGAPFILWLVESLARSGRTNYYLAPISLLVDPIYTYVIFFIDKMTNLEKIDYFGNSSGPLSILNNVYVWMILSNAVQIGIGVIFVFLASKNIRPSKK